MSNFSVFQEKMQQAGVSAAAIRAFQNNFECLVAGQTGLIPESSIQSATGLSRLDEVRKSASEASAADSPSQLLSQSVILKLNGGLGTSMGLEKAKSLLPIKNGLTFLDFIARQVLWLRQKHGTNLRFLLMNSFSTSADTCSFLGKYPELGDARSLELMQSAVPKVDAQTLRPVSWSRQPDLEWCPPGHGDLYPSLQGSGWLDRFLAEGVKYLFVSNSDNLGATLDPDLLRYFANSGRSFLMEVCERTASDRKGGHLARRDGRLLLRESAQCPDADTTAFQDIEKHRFFNTNNLWIRLDHLKALLDEQGGYLPLPIIKNAKTVDPRDTFSTKVFQLETAMGSAIECFQDSDAMVVPRTRFAPVKTTADLLALRSDAFEVTEDFRLLLAPECRGVPPMIDLDGAYYKLVDQLTARTAGGVPSLVHCHQLTVRGPVEFQTGNILRGKVSLRVNGSVPRVLPAGEYQDSTVELK